MEMMMSVLHLFIFNLTLT